MQLVTCSRDVNAKAISRSLIRDAKFTKWVTIDESDETGKRATRVEETYSFDKVGKVVEWRIDLKDANGFEAGSKVVVSWGVKKTYRFHHVIKRSAFY